VRRGRQFIQRHRNRKSAWLCLQNYGPELGRHRERWRKRTHPLNGHSDVSVPRFRSAASRGNKTESVSPLVSSLLLAVLVIIFHVYYLRLQTYV